MSVCVCVCVCVCMCVGQTVDVQKSLYEAERLHRIQTNRKQNFSGSLAEVWLTGEQQLNQKIYIHVRLQVLAADSLLPRCLACDVQQKSFSTHFGIQKPFRLSSGCPRSRYIQIVTKSGWDGSPSTQSIVTLLKLIDRLPQGFIIWRS